MSRILWIAAPRPDDISVLGKTIGAARSVGWEPVISPASRGGLSPGTLDLIGRLDPLSDAMLLLPHYLQNALALQEKDVASIRGIEVILPLATPESIPPPDALRICPHYQRVHYVPEDRDSCGHTGARCPPGKTCPIRRRCR